MINKPFIATALLLLLLVSGVSVAQEVSLQRKRLIIDNRAMPPKSIANTAKPRVTTATNSRGLTNHDIPDIASATSNETVSQYFEVSQMDFSPTNWLDALQSCQKYNSGTGNITWRLPTQRELMLIWVLHEDLVVIDRTYSVVNAFYWSATEDHKGQSSWTVNYENLEHFSELRNKSEVSRYRCVRDSQPLD